MAIGIKQNLSQTQQLTMTPQLQQAIKLLQLTRLELEDFVTEQLAENPVLEEGADMSKEEQRLSASEAETSAEDLHSAHINSASDNFDKIDDQKGNEVDWSQYNKTAETQSKASVNHDAEAPNYENMVSNEETLTSYLMNQVGDIDFSEEEQKIARTIIGNIDEKGYFTLTVNEFSEQEKFDIDLVEGVLDTIQRLEPFGIAARDLKECLLIQVRAYNMKNGIIEKIISNHLSELETRNVPAIAKALSITNEQVIENIQLIGDLDPVPARQFGSSEQIYIVPDVYIFQINNEWVVSLNEDGLPTLRVSRFYQEMLDAKQTKDADKDYIRKKMGDAEWLISSIQRRQQTIYKVAQCILNRQKNFFEHGVSQLRPMVLRDVADDIEVSESTISRTTKNKYVHTPRGIFELKYFFNSSVSRSDGSDLASESVKRMIADLVGREDPKKPLSDQKIVDYLESKSIQLARRTVAKYREQLGILPSSKRKKLF